MEPLVPVIYQKARSKDWAFCFDLEYIESMSEKKRLPSHPGFCIIPWIHMHLSTEGKVYSCIEATSEKNVFGDISEQSFEEIWNNAAIRELRLQMMDGKLPSQCIKCHRQEGFGKISRRQQNNSDFSQHSDVVLSTKADGTVPEMKFRYMDFRLSNICNLRCKMCMPLNSSSLFEDFQSIYGPQPGQKHIRLIDSHPEHYATIMEQLEEVQIIYFAGGEPLMMDEHYAILERLIELGRESEVLLAYNTNFTRLRHRQYRVTELWKRFPRVRVFASIDGRGEQLSYLRKGAVWDEILKNRNEVRSEAPHVEFTVTPVLSLMNAAHVIDLHKALVAEDFMPPGNFLLYFLYEPDCFSVEVLPKEDREKLSHEYRTYLRLLSLSLPGSSDTMNSFQAAVNFLSRNDHTHLIPKFKDLILRFDAAQRTDFRQTFPELARLLE